MKTFKPPKQFINSSIFPNNEVMITFNFPTKPKFFLNQNPELIYNLISHYIKVNENLNKPIIDKIGITKLFLL